MPYKVPRGIRNNNPGNITHNVTRNVARWWGQSLTQNDKHFVEFVDPVWGIRAIAKTLMTYQRKTLGGGWRPNRQRARNHLALGAID